MRQMTQDPFRVVIPFALLIATVLVGLVARRLLFGFLRRRAKTSEGHVNTLLIDTLRRPSLLWIAILAIHIATQNSEIPKSYLHYIPKTLQVLWGLSFTIALSRFAGNIVRFYGASWRGVKTVTSLSQKLVQLSILIVGIVWLLKVVFAFSVTPILTALGVGGLAVALALQDTLSNLFAGFYVSVSNLVHIDDYIRLNSGEEGFVTDINWRCTTMRTRFNTLIVVPNNKLGQAIYTNFFLPDGRMVASILIGVGPDVDLNNVDKILLEEATAAAGSITSGLTEPPPEVRFNPGPWSGAMIFQVVFSVSRFADVPRARSEMRMKLYTRLRRENIPISFPASSTPNAYEPSGS